MSQCAKIFWLCAKGEIIDINHAQYEITKAYHKGIGTAKTPQLAFQYCKMAADQNIPEAQNTLAVYFEQGLGVEKSPHFN